jgi:8-oxo-dGTP pyrophosphatase MutT (NUDIX family)
MHKVTEQMQLKELENRVPPILNVNIVLYKKKLSDNDEQYSKDTYLVGNTHRFKNNPWLFPGGRVKYDESPQEAAERI